MHLLGAKKSIISGGRSDDSAAAVKISTKIWIWLKRRWSNWNLPGSWVSLKTVWLLAQAISSDCGSSLMPFAMMDSKSCTRKKVNFRQQKVKSTTFSFELGTSVNFQANKNLHTFAALEMRQKQLKNQSSWIPKFLRNFLNTTTSWWFQPSEKY